MAQETLWSMSTTVREGERIVGFLKTAIELEGEVWNNDNQCKFQTLLIKNRQYLNDPDNTQSHNNLSKEQCTLIDDKSIEMTYEQAKSIFVAKKYKDAPMRGRQSMSPLVKLGLIYYDYHNRDKIIRVSDVGRKLANGEIDFGDFMRDALLKYQYPNPSDTGFQTWNTKPFINTLRLIQTVNTKCAKRGITEKGISTTEFGIFALSLKSYMQIDAVAERILEFRKKFEALTTDVDKKIFTEEYIEDYLEDFNNPINNCREYTDNMVRYLRLTKYIYIRGKYDHTYIDLEPRRLTEINAILANDNGAALRFTPSEWNTYMGTYGAYELPFETVSTLQKIAKEVQDEVNALEKTIGAPISTYTIPSEKEALKRLISELRAYRTSLQNIEIKQSVHSDVSKIDEAINALDDIRCRNKASLAKRLCIELEKWANVALNIINDSKLIKPNAPVGDDNEPTYTAPNGVPDIECYYDSFNSICEVTMLTSRDQWYNEGQPVMRHLRDFENANSSTPSYCLFVAPTLHTDTVNTFYMSVKYEYDGQPQKIIPITIRQLEGILGTMKIVIEKKKSFSHKDIMKLYDSCVNVNGIRNSSEWLAHIDTVIGTWQSQFVA